METKHRQILIEKLKRAERQASEYEKKFVKTGKQTDRHSAMTYRERANTIKEIIDILYTHHES